MNSRDNYLIPVLIDDTIQVIKFFPSKDINYFATGGWDSKLRLFEIKYQIISQNYEKDDVSISANQINLCQHQSPILSASWKGNSGNIITGCVDGSINCIDIQKNVLNKIGQHNSGCKEVLYHDKYNILLTGGWDGALKLWDLRSPNSLASYQFNNKIYSMSYGNNLLVLALSECVMSYFNLEKLQNSIFEPELIFYSHLSTPTKKVTVFNDGCGFAQSSTEGRVAIKFLNLYSRPEINKETNKINTDKDFTFKCHREFKNGLCHIYPINDIAINPVYGSLCTVGGNGCFCVWDLIQRVKLSENSLSESSPLIPLTACDYNKNGDLLVVAQGYDWSKGATFASNYIRPKIYIHYLQKNERKK